MSEIAKGSPHASDRLAMSDETPKSDDSSTSTSLEGALDPTANLAEPRLDELETANRVDPHSQVIQQTLAKNNADRSNFNADAKMRASIFNELCGRAVERESSSVERLHQLHKRCLNKTSCNYVLRQLTVQLSVLEFAMDAIDTLTRDESDSTVSNSSVTSMEYKGKPTPIRHYAIDVLTEESTIPRQTGLLSRMRNQTRNLSGNMVSSTYSLPTKQRERPGVYPLPERIRINSVATKRILNTICDSLLSFKSDPLILLTPFHLLVHVEQEIRDRMAELERDLVGKEAQPIGKDPEGTDGRRIDDSTRFPEGLIFSLGTDWSKLTVDESKEAVNDFRCLVSFIDDYINPLRNYLKDPKLVRFQELWYLFPLGSLVYVKEKSVPQKIWRVIQARGGRKYLSEGDKQELGWEDMYTPFILNCYHLDYDGSKFVRVFHKFEVDKFTELLAVSSLPIVPLFVAKHEQMVDLKSCFTRGEQFLDCTKPSYLHYEGRSLSRTPIGTDIHRPSSDGIGLSRVYSEIIESQVMIDFERALQAMPDWSPASNEIERISMNKVELENRGGAEDYERQDDDSKWTARIEAEFLQKEEKRWQKWDKTDDQPSGDDLLLFPDRVFAFVFRTRSWVCLQLGHDSDGQNRLRAVRQQLDAWDDLEIPDGHKNIVQSLIESHFAKHKARRMNFDLVRNKGKGVIIVLHGAPGVGKTSTAECVAESNNRPLLPITCGDLGLTAKDVETKLQISFELAQAWDCVLLLDEADVFLAQRKPENIKRNALVSVFLRVLEYYEGILFLTTNRVGSFDEAFKSRIHMALYYPPLNWQQSEKIWKSQIRRTLQPAKGIKCNEIVLLRYADELFKEQTAEKSLTGPAWNGRQIRNAFQSAVALAKYRTESSEIIDVKREHFERVATASNEFNQYLQRVQCKTDADEAKHHKLRDDNFNPNTTTTIPIQNSYRHDMLQRPAFGSQNPAARPVPLPQPQMYTLNGQVPYQTNAQTFGHPTQSPPNFVVQPQLIGSSQGQQQMYNPQGAIPMQQQGMYGSQYPQAQMERASNFEGPPVQLQPQPQPSQIEQNSQPQALGQPDASNQRMSAAQSQSQQLQMQMQPSLQGQSIAYYQ